MLTQNQIKEILKSSGFLPCEEINTNNIEEYYKDERIESIVKTHMQVKSN